MVAHERVAQEPPLPPPRGAAFLRQQCGIYRDPALRLLRRSAGASKKMIDLFG
jgi:hypothetical protein